MTIKNIVFFILLSILYSCNYVNNTSNTESLNDTTSDNKIVSVLMSFTTGDLHSFVMLTSDDNYDLSFLDTIAINGYSGIFVLDTISMNEISKYLKNKIQDNFDWTKPQNCKWTFSFTDNQSSVLTYKYFSNHDVAIFFNGIRNIITERNISISEDALYFFQHWEQILYISAYRKCI